ncbi:MULTISPECIES: Uma2 family endonuclease [unclassified Microbulbifer]|uniref:Uma2 family endonuclease n=1 Tax=unclassified Microbulbifer TaxID=2619833 RepID=UPI0027E3F1DC|nr:MULTISPECIES: Uma2 family endonuclease [unclassified Microbulbifer]
MALQQRDCQHHTYADYLTWPEDVRYELIDGTAYLMSPAPSRQHQEVALEMARQVANTLEGKPCRPYIAPFDVRLPKSDEADDLVDTVVQPDLLVVCDATKLDDRGLRGAPDWVVEVLTPATAGHDQTRKLAAYERARVPEVWLIHPADRVLTIYRLQGEGYGRPDIRELEGQTPAAAVPDVTIDWEPVLQRLDE